MVRKHRSKMHREGKLRQKVCQDPKREVCRQGRDRKGPRQVEGAPHQAGAGVLGL